MRLPSSLRMEDLLHGVVLVEVRGEGGADEAHRHTAVGRRALDNDARTADLCTQLTVHDDGGALVGRGDEFVHGLDDEVLDRQQPPLLRVDEVVAQLGDVGWKQEVEAGAAWELADRCHDTKVFEEVVDPVRCDGGAGNTERE